MLATARRHLPQLHALLMDRATFDAHAAMAVAEPQPCDAPWPPALLPPHEAALAQHLMALPRGRLEQEFLPANKVASAIDEWMNGTVRT